jgi:hypothetical protein
MKSFAAFTLTAVVSALDNATFEFMQYVAQQGRNYATLEEFNMRQELFTVRDNIIKEFNSNPEETSTMGHNFLSDWTAAEQKSLRGLDMNNSEERSAVPLHQVVANDTYDETVNWCSSNNPKGWDACTPVKDQGQCGGCWAFSATETVESIISIENGTTPVALSTQQLVSCSSAYGNAGCNGGWYYYAWNYLQVNAQETEASYPYSSGSKNFGITGTCTANEALGVVKTDSPTDYVKVGRTVAEIQSALNLQPTSIAIDASMPIFQSYTGGVITNASLCGTTLDHAVVAVGYGTDATTGIAYFIVRNSWGSSWGLGGFVYLEATNYPGMCGMNSKVYYPNAQTV